MRITAGSWPVFSAYEIADVRGRAYVVPADGAHIRHRVNMLDAARRQKALEAIVSTVRWPERAGSPGGSIARRLGVGTPSHSALLAYISTYGMLGLGLSRLQRVAQAGTVASGERERVITIRQAGALHTAAMRVDTPTPLQITLEPRMPFEEPRWEYALHGYGEATAIESAFAHRVGSDEWWSQYGEPLDEIVQSVGLLSDEGRAFEQLLGDTAVFPPRVAAQEADRRNLEMRAVSPLGSLALGVAEGGLSGVEICEWERCRARFIPSRKDQVFHSKACKSAHHRKYGKLEDRSNRNGGE